MSADGRSVHIACVNWQSGRYRMRLLYSQREAATALTMYYSTAIPTTASYVAASTATTMAIAVLELWC